MRAAGIFAAALAAAFVIHLIVVNAVPPYWALVVNICGVSIVLAVSLNVINGLTGQFSLGHAGFMAIGAYVSAYFTTTLRYFDPAQAKYVAEAPVFNGEWGFIPALLIGGIAAALAGALVGIPTLRLKGDYLAIATLGFGEIVSVMLTNFNRVGGSKGLTGVPAYASTFSIYGVAALCIVFSAFLQRSTFGRALIAIRENELAAEVMGIPVTRMKVMAFIYGAFFAGVAGGLFAHLYQTISPGNFNFMKSIEVVVMLVLGGLGSMSGAIIGAVLLTVLPEALRDVESGTHGRTGWTFVLLYGALWFPAALLALGRVRRLPAWVKVLVVGVLAYVVARLTELVLANEAGLQPQFAGIHVLVYALFASPIGFVVAKLVVRNGDALRRALVTWIAAWVLGAGTAIAFWIQREDGSQPKLTGVRMAVFAMALILLMIFRPQGIFGQRELSLRLLRRLVPGLKPPGEQSEKEGEDDRPA